MYFHGSRYTFGPGSLLTPEEAALHVNQGFGAGCPDYVHYSRHRSVAAEFATYAYGPDDDLDARPRVYQVQPIGDHEPDPGESARFACFRSGDPIVVLREFRWDKYWLDADGHAILPPAGVPVLSETEQRHERERERRRQRGLWHPLRLSQAQRARLDKLSERQLSRLPADSDEHEYVWGFRRPRPDEEHLNRLEAVVTRRPLHQLLLAEAGHAMTWTLDAAPAAGYGCCHEGRCHHCGATMRIEHGGTTIGRGSARCARDVPCRGPGTAWQDEMEYELQQRRAARAIGRYAQAVRDAQDRAWLLRHGIVSGQERPADPGDELEPGI